MQAIARRPSSIHQCSKRLEDFILFRLQILRTHVLVCMYPATLPLVKNLDSRLPARRRTGQKTAIDVSDRRNLRSYPIKPLC